MPPQNRWDALVFIYILVIYLFICCCYPRWCCLLFFYICMRSIRWEEWALFVTFHQERFICPHLISFYLPHSYTFIHLLLTSIRWWVEHLHCYIHLPLCVVPLFYIYIYVGWIPFTLFCSLVLYYLFVTLRRFCCICGPLLLFYIPHIVCYTSHIYLLLSPYHLDLVPITDYPYRACDRCCCCVDFVRSYVILPTFVVGFSVLLLGGTDLLLLTPDITPLLSLLHCDLGGWFVLFWCVVGPLASHCLHLPFWFGSFPITFVHLLLFPCLFGDGHSVFIYLLIHYIYCPSHTLHCPLPLTIILPGDGVLMGGGDEVFIVGGVLSVSCCCCCCIGGGKFIVLLLLFWPSVVVTFYSFGGGGHPTWPSHIPSIPILALVCSILMCRLITLPYSLPFPYIVCWAICCYYPHLLHLFVVGGWYLIGTLFVWIFVTLYPRWFVFVVVWHSPHLLHLPTFRLIIIYIHIPYRWTLLSSYVCYVYSIVCPLVVVVLTLGSGEMGWICCSHGLPILCGIACNHRCCYATHLSPLFRSLIEISGIYICCSLVVGIPRYYMHLSMIPSSPFPSIVCIYLLPIIDPCLTPPGWSFGRYSWLLLTLICCYLFGNSPHCIYYHNPHSGNLGWSGVVVRLMRCDGVVNSFYYIIPIYSHSLGMEDGGGG